MPSTRDIRRRIKSIHGTRKITRAMQLVSAAKMRKAQEAVVSSRTYSGLAWELILNLTKSLETRKPLLSFFPKAKKNGVVLLSTNRGLVGGLNTNLAAKLKDIQTEAEIITEIISYGKKGRSLAVRMNQNIVADFPKVDRGVTIEEIYPLAKFITDAYKTGEYRRIFIVYNHFVSTLNQKVATRQLLPFAPEIVSQARKRGEDVRLEAYGYNYLFEPNPKRVLDHLLPRIVESQIYQAILESDASEHSARMIMMKNATDAAGELISDLTLTYNQIRQNKITTELAEITAGKITLEG